MRRQLVGDHRGEGAACSTWSSDRDHHLCIPLLRQRPDPVDHDALKMFARNVSIDRFLIAVNFPQRKDIRILAASADFELDHAQLFA